MSDYTLDSLAQSLSAAPVDFWVSPSDVPESCPFKLTTTDVGIIFPGLASKYGLGLPVYIKVQPRNMKNITLVEASDTISINADIDTQFYVNKTDGT